MCVCAGVVVTGEGVEAVGFVQRHPEVLLNILVFGITSAVGQVRGRGPSMFVWVGWDG